MNNMELCCEYKKLGKKKKIYDIFIVSEKTN